MTRSLGLDRIGWGILFTVASVGVAQADLYWTEVGFGAGPGRIVRPDNDGANQQVLVGGVTSPGVSYDSAADQIYFTSIDGPGYIERVNSDGSDRTVVYTFA